MCRWIFASRAALLLGLALGIAGVHGQSLKIKTIEGKYWIEATAAAGEPVTLQASHNLHLWVNIQGDIQDSYSFQLDEAAGTPRYYRIVPPQEPPSPIRLMIIGDSMGSECCGWGGGMPSYLNEHVTLINYSIPSHSTKVFLQSEWKDKMLLIKPHYVIMQYAYMDGSAEEFAHTQPPEFDANMRTIINMIQGFGGKPILATVQASRKFDGNGKIIPSRLYYDPANHQLATEFNLPLLDIYSISKNLYNEMGPVASDFIHWVPGSADDQLHMSPLGAVHVSRMISQNLPDVFGPYLTRAIYDAPPPPP